MGGNSSSDMAPVNNQTGIKEKCSCDICCITLPCFNVPELKAETKKGLLLLVILKMFGVISAFLPACNIQFEMK